METNFEDYVKAGLITTDQLVELRTKIQEIMKIHPNLGFVEALNELNNLDKEQTE